MKYLFLILLSFYTTLNSSNNIPLNIALYGVDKKLANEKTVEKLLLKLFEKIDYLKDKQINTFFYNSEELLLSDLQSEEKKFDFLYLVPSIYLKYYELINNNSLNPINMKATDEKYIQYYLITNKSSNINSIKDIKSSKLVLKNADTLAQIWLEKVFYDKGMGNYENNIKLVKSKNYKQYKKVLDVYFKKVDLSVVTKNTWETTISLNPSIKKHIKILEKSPEIFPGIIAVSHKSINKKIFKSFNKFIFNEENEEYLSNILGLVKLKNAKKVNKDDFKKADIFYNDYLKLSKKYK